MAALLTQAGILTLRYREITLRVWTQSYVEGGHVFFKKNNVSPRSYILLSCQVVGTKQTFEWLLAVTR